MFSVVWRTAIIIIVWTFAAGLLVSLLRIIIIYRWALAHGVHGVRASCNKLSAISKLQSKQF